MVHPNNAATQRVVPRPPTCSRGNASPGGVNRHALVVTAAARVVRGTCSEALFCRRRTSRYHTYPGTHAINVIVLFCSEARADAVRRSAFAPETVRVDARQPHGSATWRRVAACALKTRSHTATDRYRRHDLLRSICYNRDAMLPRNCTNGDCYAFGHPPLLYAMSATRPGMR